MLALASCAAPCDQALLELGAVVEAEHRDSLGNRTQAAK